MTYNQLYANTRRVHKSIRLDWLTTLQLHTYLAAEYAASCSASVFVK